jgi:hypothetical protein
MSGKTRILLIVTFVLSTASVAIAQPRYYYNAPTPTEQQRWYDRNEAGINV